MNQPGDNAATSTSNTGRATAYYDAFLEEVWALKRAASLRAGHDIDRLCDQLKEIEKTMPNPRAKKPDPGETRRERLAS